MALAVVGCGGGDAGVDGGAGSPADAAAERDVGTAVDAAEPPVADPCEGIAAACPSPAGLDEGAGLVGIDRCAFPLEERDEWGARGGLVDALAGSLQVTDLAGVLGDLNRSAPRLAASAVPGDPPGVQQAFAWQSGDESVAYWIPQGITGSGDGAPGGRVAGRNIVLVSWYYDQAEDPGSAAHKGVRIAVTDVTDPDAVRYRFVLLVDPTTIDGRPSFAPVRIHAGGIAWVGRYLYVADTGVGFRVFDLDRLLRVATGLDLLGYDAGTGAYYAHNYAYVLPQVDTIAELSTCTPRFSFVSLDRSTSPPSLLSGEYDSDSIAGRLYRWPLDGDRLQVVAGGRVIADAAWYAAHSHLQGALSLDGTFWLSSSKPSGAAGELYRTRPGAASATLPWIDTPEDLFYDPVDDRLWSLSEGQGERHVFAVARTAVD